MNVPLMFNVAKLSNDETRIEYQEQSAGNADANELVRQNTDIIQKPAEEILGPFIKSQKTNVKIGQNKRCKCPTIE